jgi:hypothetical protein
LFGLDEASFSFLEGFLLLEIDSIMLSCCDSGFMAWLLKIWLNEFSMSVLESFFFLGKMKG